MQKHQEWLDNKQYQHHLNSLIKIRQKSPNPIFLGKSLRSKNIKSAITTRCKINHDNSQRSKAQFKLRISQIPLQQVFHAPQELSPSPGKTSLHNKTKNKAQLSLKEKERLMNNFMLGKRIIQTPPVINFKKYETNYMKQKKMLETRNQKFKNSIQNSNFREQKLSEYAVNSFTINKNFRLKTSNKFQRFRQIINLRIFSIKPFKTINQNEHKPPFKDFCIKMKYNFHQKKSQTSDIINIDIIQNYNFYFGYNPKLFSKTANPNKQNEKYLQTHNSSYIQHRNMLFFDILQVKGINLIYFGTFNISKDQLEKQQTQNIFRTKVERFGKNICCIQGKIWINLKKNMIKNNY